MVQWHGSRPGADTGAGCKAGVWGGGAGPPAQVGQLGSERLASLRWLNCSYLGRQAQVCVCQQAAHVCTAVAGHHQSDCSVHLHAKHPHGLHYP